MDKVYVHKIKNDDEVEKLFNTSAALFEGTYGCTFEVIQNLEDDGDEDEDERAKRAVKVQAYDENDTRRVQAITEEVTLALALSNVSESTTPGVVKVYIHFKSRYLPKKWFATAKKECRNFYNKYVYRRQHPLTKNLKDRTIFWYMVMELGDAGDLAEYMNSYARLGMSLDSEEIRSFAFQLMWTLHCLQIQLGFRHFDLKPENLILKSINEPRLYKFTRLHVVNDDLSGTKLDDEGKSVWNIYLGPQNQNAKLNSSRHELKLIDFGFSKVAREGRQMTHLTSNLDNLSKSQRGARVSHLQGTPVYVDPASLIMSGDAFLRGEPILRDYDADMWAVGIILINMCLTGWYRPKDLQHKEWLSGEIWPSEYPFDNPLTLWVDSTNYSQKFYDEIADQFPLMPFFIGMCLLNDALGNGIFPDLTIWPELKNSAFYNMFFDLKHDVKTKAVKRNSVVSGGKKNIYEHIVDRIKEKIGDSGLELVKKLLVWSPHQRAHFGFQTSTPLYFYPALLSKYFAPFRQNLYDIMNAKGAPRPLEDTLVYDWKFEGPLEPISLMKRKNVSRLGALESIEKDKVPKRVLRDVRAKAKTIVDDKQNVLKRLRNGKVIYVNESPDKGAKKRRIGHIICMNCIKNPATIACSMCKDIGYCSKDCQSDHWRLHKKKCL